MQHVGSAPAPASYLPQCGLQAAIGRSARRIELLCSSPTRQIWKPSLPLPLRPPSRQRLPRRPPRRAPMTLRSHRQRMELLEMAARSSRRVGAGLRRRARLHVCNRLPQHAHVCRRLSRTLAAAPHICRAPCGSAAAAAAAAACRLQGAGEDGEGGAQPKAGGGAAQAQEINPMKKRKIALFLAYVGHGYQGMQVGAGAGGRAGGLQCRAEVQPVNRLQAPSAAFPLGCCRYIIT